MSTAERITPPLVSGEKLDRDEFLRRWEALPELRFAELLEGEVYLPSPLSLSHGSQDSLVNYWLRHYAASTPGCGAYTQPTWLMLRDAPQPDCCLRILPEYGGQSSSERGLGSGAPELIVEVAVSSAARDLGPKLRLYRAAGVQEYITLLVEPSQLIWRRLVAGSYSTLDPGSDGILRSAVFPGLWLHPGALLSQDDRRVLEVLNQGLQSTEHGEFAQELSRRRK